MKIIITAIILTMTLIALGTADSEAEVYTWTDENGVRHFSDRKPSDAQGAKPAFQAYEHDEAADRQRSEEDAKEIQKAVKSINEEYAEAEQEKRRQEAEAEANRPPNMEERVEEERRKLNLKIAELESLPLDNFGSHKNKIRIIGYYKYRLQDLEKDPEKYFREPPPRFEGNVKNPSDVESNQ